MSRKRPLLPELEQLVRIYAWDLTIEASGAATMHIKIP